MLLVLLFTALLTPPHPPTEAHSSAREEDAQEPPQHQDQDYSSDEEDSFIEKPAPQPEDDDSSILDKENFSTIPKPTKQKKSTSSESHKRKLPKGVSSTATKKKKHKKRRVSDESSARSSSSKTSRSVLSDMSRSHVQARRVSDSQGLTTMLPPARKRKATHPEQQSSDDDEPPAKKTKLTPGQQIKQLELRLQSETASVKKQSSMITKRDDKIQELKDYIEELLEEIEGLKRSNRKRQVGVPVNKGIKLVVKTYTNNTVWHYYKFIADEEELDEIMENILLSCEDGVKILAEYDGDDKKGERAALIRSYSLTYGPDICKSINGKRSSTQSALYDCVMTRRNEHKKRVPKPDVFLKIIRRKGLQYKIEEGETEPTPENKRAVDSNREVFDWYVDELLPKVVGFSNWGPNQKFHGKVSSYTLPNSEELYVPKNAEAFIMLIMENCEKKWDYCYRCLAKGKKINRKAVKWNDTKYSSARSGHNPFGGWNDEGRIRFVKLQEIIGK